MWVIPIHPPGKRCRRSLQPSAVFLMHRIMDKESLYLLQKIDCNCNDCTFMIRDLTRPPIKGKAAAHSFGHCSYFDKPVSFIPGICQIETQQCFIHRKDLRS